MRYTVMASAFAASIATMAMAQDATVPIDLDVLDYRSNPLFPGVETAIAFGDRNSSDLYATHARLSAGTRIPPHTHPNTITTWVTSGTAYVGTGEEFDENRLRAYPAGTFFVTPAGSPHFIAAMDGPFAILDHGSGPSGFQLVDPQ